MSDPSMLTLRNILHDVQATGDYDTGVQRLVERLEKRVEHSDAGYYYRALLKRPPETPEAASRPVGDMKSEIDRIIFSPEFKIAFGRLVSEEFPELRRDLFIHVPKTAGSSIIAAARRDANYVVLRAPSWGFDDIRDFRKYFLDAAKSIFLGAQTILFEKHLRVSDVDRHNMARPQDRIFTLIRDPLLLLVSWINYTLTSFSLFDSENIDRYDIRDMRRLAGVESDYDPKGQADWTVISRIIDQIMWTNPHCRCLGGDDAQSAYDNIVRLGIRVYDSQNLDPLFSEMGWQPTRANISRPFVTLSQLPAAIKNRLVAMSDQDVILCSRLRSAGLLSTDLM